MENAILIDVKMVSSELKIRPEIYIKLVQSFVNSLPGKLNILQDAIAQNNRDQMRMTLHEIRGTAGNLRLLNLSQVEAVMHDALKNGATLQQMSVHLDTLQKTCDSLQKYVVTMKVE